MTASSATSTDLDLLFEKMKEYVARSSISTGITMDDLETKMSQSTTAVQAVCNQLSQSVSRLTARVDAISKELKSHQTKISTEMQCQNVIILGMQKQFQETMSDFSSKLQAIYTAPENTANFVSPPASTSKQGHWRDPGK